MANSIRDLGKTGVKYDKFKNRLDLLPTDALREVALAFTYGAHKYSDRNWERGVNHSQLYRAALNHLMAWHERDDFDDETALPHLAHAGACILMLLSIHLRGVGNDDRPPAQRRALGNGTDIAKLHRAAERARDEQSKREGVGANEARDITLHASSEVSGVGV
tara:strand:- start:3941 stop:4429 length:489 start_codon:yes stop_codon:yes gene_type:complete